MIDRQLVDRFRSRLPERKLVRGNGPVRVIQAGAPVDLEDKLSDMKARTIGRELDKDDQTRGGFPPHMRHAK